jgi:hypothetical protein
MPGTVAPLVGGAILGAVVVAVTLGGRPGWDDTPSMVATPEPPPSLTGERIPGPGFEEGLRALSVLDSPRAWERLETAETE